MSWCVSRPLDRSLSMVLTSDDFDFHVIQTLQITEQEDGLKSNFYGHPIQTFELYRKKTSL